MKINEQEFNKATELLKGVNLSEHEKDSMLSAIYSNEATSAPIISSTPSPFVISSLFLRNRLVITVASFILLVTGGGYAAAGSLPGEPLYGLKVNLLEPMALILTLDKNDKYEYKIKLLQRRVAELQTLKLNSNINAETEAASHQAAERNVIELEASDVLEEERKNVDIQTSVEIYNSIISEPFRLEIKMIKKEVVPTTKEEGPETKEINVDAVIEQTTKINNVDDIKEVVEKQIESIKPVDETVQEVKEKIEDVAPVTPVDAEEIKTDVINTINENLGL